jgi:hypothetical protein
MKPTDHVNQTGIGSNCGIIYDRNFSTLLLIRLIEQVTGSFMGDSPHTGRCRR